MKVFSLQAPIYRGAWLSSRLTAQTSQLAAVRRDALERWRRARSRGLSAEEAARAVGAPSCARPSDVGQAQARRPLAPGGDRRLGLDGGAHPDEAHGESRRHARADASSQTRSTPLAHHGPAPRQASAQGHEANQAGRTRPDRTLFVNVAPDK